MPTGMIVRDASNRVIVDTTSRLSTVLGFVGITGSGSLVNGLLSRGTPWYVLTARNEVAGSDGLVTVSFSGTTMSWVASGLAAGSAFYITYGVR